MASSSLDAVVLPALEGGFGIQKACRAEVAKLKRARDIDMASSPVAPSSPRIPISFLSNLTLVLHLTSSAVLQSFIPSEARSFVPRLTCHLLVSSPQSLPSLMLCI
jgi:hypothetical protein